MKDLLKIIRVLSIALKQCKNPKLIPIFSKMYSFCTEAVKPFLEYIKSECAAANEMITFIELYYFKSCNAGQLAKETTSLYMSADTYRSYVSRAAKKFDKKTKE